MRGLDRPGQLRKAAALVVALALGIGPLAASSHREAPFLTRHPKVDATDFYMFNSYESGRDGFVTIIANYLPLQDPYGGPNYFSLDPNALYEIHIDNNGDAKEDITFQFKFQNTVRDLQLAIGPAGATKQISVPVINIGAITSGNTGQLNVIESYTVKVVRGNRRTGRVASVTNAITSESSFLKPVDNIGNRSIPDYATYAGAHVYTVNLPDSTSQGRLFVGQRKDPFVVNLGETFDLIGVTNPLGAVDAERDSLADKNVTSLCLEVPASYLKAGTSSIIAGWTTASLRQARVLNPRPPRTAAGKPLVEGGAWVQQSRLGMPLVNEVVIGLKDKDRFNASKPADDAQFLDYVTHPTLPAILELLYGAANVKAPTQYPRNDLVAVFLTGLEGLNKTATACEMLRLNTSIAAVPRATQKNLGALAADNAGFPNGRRPGDDVVDIALRVVMGALVTPASDAPSGTSPFTDGAVVNASMFDESFPYLKTPLPGAPN